MGFKVEEESLLDRLAVAHPGDLVEAEVRLQALEVEGVVRRKGLAVAHQKSRGGHRVVAEVALPVAGEVVLLPL